MSGFILILVISMIKAGTVHCFLSPMMIDSKMVNEQIWSIQPGQSWQQAMKQMNAAWQQKCLRQIVTLRRWKGGIKSLEVITPKQKQFFTMFCLKKSNKIQRELTNAAKEYKDQQWKERFDRCMKMFNNAAQICLQNSSFFMWAQKLAKDVMEGKNTASNN